MKKTIGYGFKLNSESAETALRMYTDAGSFCKSVEEVKKEILLGKQNGNVPRNAKPKIFKIVMETV